MYSALRLSRRGAGEWPEVRPSARPATGLQWRRRLLVGLTRSETRAHVYRAVPKRLPMIDWSYALGDKRPASLLVSDSRATRVR